MEGKLLTAVRAPGSARQASRHSASPPSRHSTEPKVRGTYPLPGRDRAPRGLPAELLQVLDDVCADVLENAIGEAEVAERLVVVASGSGTAEHATYTEPYSGGNVVAFVNDSGVPFVE